MSLKRVGQSADDVKSERRDFLKKTLITSAYVAPTIVSFSAKDVAKASPGGGFGGGRGGGRGKGKGKGKD